MLNIFGYSQSTDGQSSAAWRSCHDPPHAVADKFKRPYSLSLRLSSDQTRPDLCVFGQNTALSWNTGRTDRPHVSRQLEIRHVIVRVHCRSLCTTSAVHATMQRTRRLQCVHRISGITSMNSWSPLVQSTRNFLFTKNAMHACCTHGIHGWNAYVLKPHCSVWWRHISILKLIIQPNSHLLQTCIGGALNVQMQISIDMMYSSGRKSKLTERE